MATKKQDYGNDSISSLKGADRVRKRPGVIFGSDGLDGCEHAVFEILSNSIDEAREGHGRVITVTRFNDRSIEVEDMGRGCPVDWNEKEQRYNWELVYCELYAGGKYDNLTGDNYEYSLGLNGLGACATQYASHYMDVTVWRDGHKYSLHFERGEIVGEMKVEPTDRGKRPAPAPTGCRIWTCSPTLPSRRNTLRMCCAVRRWSTRESPSNSAISRKTENLKSRNSSMSTGFRTMWLSWPERAP